MVNILRVPLEPGRRSKPWLRRKEKFGQTERNRQELKSHHLPNVPEVRLTPLFSLKSDSLSISFYLFHVHFALTHDL